MYSASELKPQALAEIEINSSYVFFLKCVLLNFAEPVIPTINASDKKIRRYELTSVVAGIGSSIETIVENNITLLCPAKGFPEPSFTWKSKSSIGPLVSGGRIVIEGKTLTIVKAQERDSGKYQCTATNVEGSESVVSEIRVIGKE